MLERSELCTRLLRAMYLAKDPDHLCDYIANYVLVECGAVASYIAILMADSTISMEGAWGYTASRRAADDRPSLSQRMAVTDTVLTGNVHAFETWEHYLETYPDLGHRASPGISFVGIPLLEASSRYGALGLTFDRPLSEVGLSAADWALLGSCAQLFVERICGNAVGATYPVTDMKATRPLLTAKELEVLERSAQGQTVREISKELHLSESSIKKYRMSLYRKLHIDSKADLRYAAEVLTGRRARQR